MKIQNLFPLVLLCAGLMLTWLSASAQTNVDLNEFIEQEAKRHSIPNSVVVWVKDGEVHYQKITQDTDLIGSEAIDTQKSLFRIGSISKPFTGLGALILKKNGFIDFDADINSYFDQQLIPYKFSKAITVNHLLTHTAGFDDFYINKSVRSKDELRSLEHYIKSSIPHQVTAPGEVSTYSNYGVALLGYIMEKVSETDFPELMRDLVFKPLNMQNTGFELKENDYPNLVKSWYSAFDEMKTAPFDYVKDLPAGQMFTTVDDMVGFMRLITVPTQGQPANSEMYNLFKESITPRFTHHQKLQGAWASLWNLGYYSGHELVSHDGGYVGTASRLFYFPEHKQALFVFSNLMNFGYITSVTNELISQFLPETSPKTDNPDIYPVEISDNFSLKDFSGYYRNTRYSRQSMLKISSLFSLFGVGSELKIKNDGQHLVMSDHMGNPRRLVRTDTLLFSSIDDDYHIAFRKQGNKITHVFTSGTTALEKISFLESQIFSMVILFISVILFIVLIINGLVGVFKGLIKKSFRHFNSVSLLTTIVSLAYILQFVFLYLGGMTIEPYEIQIGFAYGVPKLFYLANLFPIIAVLFTVVLQFYISKEKTVGRQLVFSIFFTLISVLYFFTLNYWNLVGWKF